MSSIRIARRASMRAVVVGLLLLGCSGSAWAVSITEYAIPTASSRPYGITAGPDGNLWFTENLTGKIGRITPAGTMTEFSTSGAGSGPHGIASGADGNLWFTESSYGAIGRITPSGAISEFAIPASWNFPSPSGITSGPDGNLWFAATGYGGSASYIGRITTGGAMTGFALPSFPGRTPYEIAAGPDGNLWFTENGGSNGNSIGRITPSGAITEFPLPTAFVVSQLLGITAGPDGNLWFAESSNKVGRITPAGAITEFSVPPSSGYPAGITSGPDGSLWFTENNGFIGRITPGGAITEFPIPTASSNPFRIRLGPDGALWFTESGTGKIGRVTLGVVSGPTALHTLTPCRVLDTRIGSGALGGPALAPFATRDFNVTGVCGIPSGAIAISANLTVTNVGAQGDLVIFPAGTSRPGTSAISFFAGRTRANNSVVFLSGSTTTFSVYNNSASSLDFVLDVNGYFQ